MKTLKISYPVIIFNTIEVQVDDEKADDLVLHHNGREDFIMQQIEEKEPLDVDWLLMPIRKAIESDFAKIEFVK